jgi:predicted TIM-barrel fold metal-dependent hydrolase
MIPRMSIDATSAEPPEHNVTGLDYADRRHFRYTGPPLIDMHAHVTLTKPTAAPGGSEPQPNLDQADIMLDVAREFGVGHIMSICAPEDIPPLRKRFGDRVGFSGSISKKLEQPEDTAYRLLDRYLELGIEVIKLWSAPRGRERGLDVDAPWRIEAVRRARAAGIRVFMVHVADPDVWFHTTYADAAKFGTKADQYVGLERLLQMFPDVSWIAAHMGGDPEHADHLDDLLERYPHLHFDTSATKWQVREVSAHRDAIQSLILRYPDRFLFGSDLVTRPGLTLEHYVSRYWCQRTLWESPWEGRSPVADPDYVHAESAPATPLLLGLNLPAPVLATVYHGNAARLLKSQQAQPPCNSMTR